MGKRLENEFDHARAKMLLKECGRTLTWTASRLNISRGYLGQVLAGKCNPSETVVKELAAILEITKDELLRSTDAA